MVVAPFKVAGVRPAVIYMRIITLGMIMCLGGALSFGAVWRGAKLVDASCFDENGKVRHIGSMCAPTESTTNFAMETRTGHVYKLDALSNQKAEKALEDGVIRPNRHGDYRARIMGHHESKGFVTVSSIVRGGRGEY